MYMKIHVPSMLLKGVKQLTNKHNKQTSIHNGLENL